MSEKYIRKIIREALVQEDAHSTKEIEDLANDIWLAISRELAKLVNTKIMSPDSQENNMPKYIFLPPIFLKDILGQTKNKYKTLLDFIENSGTKIWPKPKQFNGSSENGVYFPPSALYEKPPLITVFYDKDFREELKNIVVKNATEYFNNPPGGEKPLNYDDFYFDIFWHFNDKKALQHELQHAYDDYRSYGKVFDSKASYKHADKYGFDQSVEDEKKKARHISYLKLPHEIWARFNQAVSKTDFLSVDRREHEDGLKYSRKEMFDIHDVLKYFIHNFYGWKVLSPKTKKRLTKGLVQYWYLQQKEAQHFTQVSKAQAELLKYQKEKELSST